MGWGGVYTGIVSNYNNFFNTMNNENNNRNRGFTLIELLIVIAIIGVLAATVVVSLGSQTDHAKEGSLKIGVSSVRSLATVEATSPSKGNDLSGTKLCSYIYGKVSGEKEDWTWKASVVNDAISGTPVICSADDSTTKEKSGEICCSADGNKWVIWSALPTADGTGAEKDVYCADSSGFTGEVELQADSGSASTKVTDGRSSDNPTSCQ